MKKYLFISFLLLTACKKEKVNYNVLCNNPTNEIPPSRQLFIGKWNWISELYFNQSSGQTILKTPISEGYTRELTVNNADLFFSKNTLFEDRYKYDFVVESSITSFPSDTMNVLVFKDFTTAQINNYVHFTICNDTLILNFQIRSSFKGQEKWSKL